MSHKAVVSKHERFLGSYHTDKYGLFSLGNFFRHTHFGQAKTWKNSHIFKMVCHTRQNIMGRRLGHRKKKLPCRKKNEKQN